jgi:aryl-alcohol dehydrogenase-like predicted oxidoreductase
MSIDTQPLGPSGMEISRVGFGAWAIGGGWSHGWGKQDDRESIAAIHRAVELGVNWIDTAAVYGLGHSEHVVGRALAALPAEDRPLVFTKCGLRWDEADPGAEIRQALNPASVRRELESSLRRLGLDHVDLYQVHWPPQEPPTPLDEYWGAMVDLRIEGKVRAIGLSNHDVAQLEAADAIGRVDALQPPLSAIHREAADEIAWCAAHDTGVIVYSPMQSGLLTGAFSPARMEALPADDWRHRDPDFTTELARNLALADALAPVAERHGTTRAAVAVAWTLAWPGVTGAIVGARRPQQIDDWITAASLQLGDADLDEIAAAIERTGAGEGPARPPAVAA